MPNTYSALYVHIIFATKGRLPLIDSAWLGELHAYMAGTLRGLHTKPEIIGGAADHVHDLAQIKPTTDLRRLIGELKKASIFGSNERRGRVNFGWQVGYAALSASPFERRDLISYIANQQEHRARESSYDELLRLLTAADVEIDMKYFE